MNYNISWCGYCPFFDGSFMDGCECSHSDSVKRGVYQNLVGYSEKPPQWCPIRKNGGTFNKIVRDSNDNILRTDVITIL